MLCAYLVEELYKNQIAGIMDNEWNSSHFDMKARNAN